MRTRNVVQAPGGDVMNTDELAVKLAEVDQRARANTHMIEELKESTKVLTSLTISVERMASEQKHLVTSVDSLRSDLSDIKSRPGKWWEALIKALIAALVGAVIGYCIKG